MSDLMAMSGEFLGMVAGGFALFLISKAKESYKKKKNGRVVRAINRDCQIFENLVSLRATLDCDRVKMFQFYNGDYYTTGQSTLKMHMTYCSVGHGVSFPQGFMYGPEGCPVTRVTQILKPLLEKSEIFYYTSEMPNSEWQAANYLNGTEISVLIRVGSADAIQGVIVCSYTKIQEIPLTALPYARETAAAISSLLSDQ